MSSAAHLSRTPVPLPKGLTVEIDDLALTEGDYRSAPNAKRALVLKRSWRTPQLYGLLTFCLFWDGFMVLWYTIIGMMDDPPLTHVLFPLIHVAVGVGMTYRVIAGFTNTTTIAVRDGSLHISHSPLPWSRARTLAAAEIRQIYSGEKVREKKPTPTSTFYLGALLADGSKIPLVADLANAEQALFIEERLEDHLGIRDEPVEDEIERNAEPGSANGA